MKFFGMGGFELVIILVVILLIFGPKNLPKLGSALGKTVSNLRSGMNDGKKKKDADAEKPEGEGSAEETAPSEAKPAEIEGEIESVEAVEAVEFEETVGGAEAAAEPAPTAEPTSAEKASGGAAPKKVKRVVKKKVAVEETE